VNFTSATDLAATDLAAADLSVTDLSVTGLSVTDLPAGCEADLVAALSAGPIGGFGIGSGSAGLPDGGGGSRSMKPSWSLLVRKGTILTLKQSRASGVGSG
jgi:hypothetical protein